MVPFCGDGITGGQARKNQRSSKKSENSILSFLFRLHSCLFFICFMASHSQDYLLDHYSSSYFTTCRLDVNGKHINQKQKIHTSSIFKIRQNTFGAFRDSIYNKIDTAIRLYTSCIESAILRFQANYYRLPSSCIIGGNKYFHNWLYRFIRADTGY